MRYCPTVRADVVPGGVSNGLGCQGCRGHDSCCAGQLGCSLHQANLPAGSKAPCHAQKGRPEFHPVPSATAATCCILPSSALHPAPLGCSSLPFGEWGWQGTLPPLGRCTWQRGVARLPSRAVVVSPASLVPKAIAYPFGTTIFNENIETHLLVCGLADGMCG